MPTLHWGHRTCPAPRHTGQMCLTCDVGVLVPVDGLWEEPTLFGPFSELSPSWRGARVAIHLLRNEGEQVSGRRPRQGQITLRCPNLKRAAVSSFWFVGDNWRGMTEYPASTRIWSGVLLPLISQQIRSEALSNS